MGSLLTADSHIHLLRKAIYKVTGVIFCRASSRPRKLRKVCVHARGYDLRKKAHVVALARELSILPGLAVAA